MKSSGSCLVLTECLLPRNAIARKAALKDIQLTQGKRSFVRRPFYEKCLLKERVDGLFGLKVSVTRPLRHREFEKFVRRLLVIGAEHSIDLLSPLIARYAPLDEFIDAGSDHLLKSFLQDAPFIATGGLDLDSATLAAGILRVPLQLEKSIRQSNTAPGPKSREKRRPASVLYRKGSTVGFVEFDLA
ncbi:MAG: hypothetical protein EA353_05515 [Puniceicoccaceae bacterium]|nr:MAG: hypothetical protein EA353_05515 [Puniceicoccaceae bacterium]